MTDPLRPVVNLIDFITRTKRISNTPGSATGQVDSPVKSASSGNAQYGAISLTGRLNTRLSAIDRNDHKRRRRAFVEIALLSELGEQLSMDNGFSELVEDICAVIASDKSITAALDGVLDQFS
ncbi:MAG: hypothetical protein ABUS47_03635 [Steroidobacter sp.]